MKECPLCHLNSPPDAVLCDCGYDFKRGCSGVSMERDPDPDFFANKLKWVFVIVVLLVNAGLVYFAFQDRSWGALYIAFYIGPIVNGVSALVGIVFSFILKKTNPETSLSQHVGFALVFSTLGLIGLICAVFTMSLHGC